MKEKEENSEKVMFLFGAGISIPIGIPAMKGIYKSFMNKKESGISDSDKRICEFFAKTMNIEEDLEEFLLAANSIIEFKESKIKKFIDKSISPIDSASKIVDYNDRFNKKIKDVKNVRTNILEFLSKVCFMFDREMTMKINKGFVKTVSTLDYPVYSTNYDFAFEYVAKETGIEINDNFYNKGHRFLWNDKIYFPNHRGFKLIKLHGSVTWYIDNDGLIEKMDYSTAISPAGKKVEKIVIIPTRFKDIYAQNFFALYSNFLSSLNKAEVLIIGGHSLRDDYLRAGIIERNRKGNFQIIVIDPQYPETIKKELTPCKIGSMGNIIHIPYKWEQFSDQLSYILNNSAPASIIKECVNIYNTDKRGKNKVIIKGNLGTLIAHNKKKFKVQIKSYLPPNERPAKLRCWVRFVHKDSSGSNKSSQSSSFLESKEIIVGNGLNGLINQVFDVEMKVPNYLEWFRIGGKVELIVALMRASITKPVWTPTNIIAQDSKLLEYKE